jgi:hypothetical protein
MNKKQIGNIIIGFAVISSLFTVFRLYHYFFTGNDFSPLSFDQKLVATIGMVLITGIAYLVGYGMRGDLDF